MNPQFPLYIVSKGRADLRHTAKALESMRTPYHIIVEIQEFDQYAAVIDPAKILVLDPAYQERFDTCDNAPKDRGVGAGAARNFAWDHSIERGFEWHWVMDDNITFFARLNKNLKVPVGDGTVFKVMEDFVLRYKNVGMAGPNYAMFAPRKNKVPPFVVNTRIYSCNLIRNKLPFRWRGRLNEDTDLSLRILKAGWCTIQFNAFLQNKLPTQTCTGGNMEDHYSKEGTYPKSKILVDLHPDITRITWRFNRWHHHVDYSGFKNMKLIRRDDLEIPSESNEYGMKFREVGPTEKWSGDKP